jgi:hypothetical protein
MNLPLPLRSLSPAGVNATPDPTSAEALRQNIALAREHIANIQTLAQSALDGIENSYQPGHTPAQTSGE